MAKVPVLRSRWEIDPAQLALAQERTEARLADLFSRRAAAAAGRYAGRRPPIIVDGVELIGVPDGPRVMDLVDVVDPPATELVAVMVSPPSSTELVGVMAGPDEAAPELTPLTMEDGTVEVPDRGAAAAPEPTPPVEPAADLAAAPEPTAAAKSRVRRPPKAAAAAAKATPPRASASAPKAARPARPTARRTPAPGPGLAAAPPAPVVLAALCPYCALLLQPPPSANRRCPRCRQQIVVKHVEGRTAYLTEAAIAIFDAERRKVSDSGRLTREREKWLKLAIAAGAPAQKAGRMASVQLSGDVVDAARELYLATVDRAFQAAKRDHSWDDAARIRRDQAAALHRLAGSPLPPRDDLLVLYREGVAAELRGLAEIVRDAELVSAMCCDACRADSGRISAISKELSAPRLPHEGCPKVFCRCTWDLATRDRELVLRYLRRRPRAGSRPATKD